MIKVQIGRSAKIIHELWRLTFKTTMFSPYIFSITPLAIVAFSLHLPSLQLAQFGHSRLNLSRHKHKISSYHNTKLFKSQININKEPCF